MSLRQVANPLQTWTRLICFTAEERVGIFFGEPIDDLTVDIGLELSYKARALGQADDQVQKSKSKAAAAAGADADVDDDAEAEAVDGIASAVAGDIIPKPDGKVIKARVWEMAAAWSEDAKFTGEVLTVKRLKSPINPRGVIRAVGLNYKDHAVSTYTLPFTDCSDRAYRYMWITRHCDPCCVRRHPSLVDINGKSDQ